MRRWGIAAVAAMLVLGVSAASAQAAPTWSVDDVTAAEGDSGTTAVTFTITAANLGLLGSASIDYATADGTATAPGDYAAKSGTATVSNLLGGSGSTTVKVDVNGDTAPERDETFQLVLSNPSDGTISDGTGQATIVNDDKPHIRVTGTHVSEKDGAAIFTVSLDGSANVTVHYATADGSALAGSDYTPQSGTLNFSRSDVAKTVSVPIIDDTQNEGDETFQLQLSGGSGVASSGNDLTGTATIADDDAVIPLPTSGSTSGSSIATDHSPPHVILTKPRSSRGAIIVSITCPASETLCRGTLTTFSKANRRSRVRQLRHERKLGAATFVIAGGRTAVITTRLSARTLRLLRRAGKVSIRSYAVVRDASGNVGAASAGALLRRLR
jgi:Calx-beta domain